jgi:hypothetical protein
MVKKNADGSKYYIRAGKRRFVEKGEKIHYGNKPKAKSDPVNSKRKKLVAKILKSGEGNHPSEYNDWSIAELEQRVDALGNNKARRSKRRSARKGRKSARKARRSKRRSARKGRKSARKARRSKRRSARKGRKSARKARRSKRRSARKGRKSAKRRSSRKDSLKTVLTGVPKPTGKYKKFD